MHQPYPLWEHPTYRRLSEISVSMDRLTLRRLQRRILSTYNQSPLQRKVKSRSYPATKSHLGPWAECGIAYLERKRVQEHIFEEEVWLGRRVLLYVSCTARYRYHMPCVCRVEGDTPRL
jgi:hypothetical protein